MVGFNPQGRVLPAGGLAHRTHTAFQGVLVASGRLVHVPTVLADGVHADSTSAGGRKLFLRNGIIRGRSSAPVG